MTESVLELNIVSIVLGVLIIRILWIWMETSSLYVQSVVKIDPDDAVEDKRDALEQLPGTVAATAVTIFLIAIIIAGYIKTSIR